MYSVYHRIKPLSSTLSNTDYVYGFGMDTSHYNRVHNKRKELGLDTRDNYIDSWDSRTGFDITGAPLNTKYHPLHDVKLLEKETGKIYIIDLVCKHHHYGYYIMLLIRQEGSKSHGSVLWENISCLDNDTLNSIKENQERFTILNKDGSEK